jgi:hypothetical protein
MMAGEVNCPFEKKLQQKEKMIVGWKTGSVTILLRRYWNPYRFLCSDVICSLRLHKKY